MHYHVFICHADEDKPFAKQLVNELKSVGVAVWFDEDQIRLGSSIRQSIDNGLVRAEFGIVLLSPTFFSKGWANRELNGLVAREMAEARTVVLPVWLGVDHAEIARHSPTLADVRGIPFDGELVSLIVERLDLARPYRQLRGAQHVELLTPDGSQAEVTLRREVQVGTKPLTSMDVRIPSSDNFELIDVSPGVAGDIESRLDHRWALTEYETPFLPGQVFTQEWKLRAADEYSTPDNGVGVSATLPYESFELSVSTSHPGTIGNPRMVQEIGGKEIELEGVRVEPHGNGFSFTVERPAVSDRFALYWDNLGPPRGL